MAALAYRGYTFPGYNTPIAAPRGDTHKKMVLARKGARTKLVRYGLRGMQDYTQHGDLARRKSYLARSAGIRDKRGRLTKDDIFSANYWARRDLWAANPHNVIRNPIMATNTFIAGDYHIESIGNGFAYSITDQRTGKNLYVQDSDADIIRDRTNDFENTDALQDYFDVVENPRRSATKRNPRKRSYAAEFDSMMGRKAFEGMMKPKDDYINLGGDRVKNDKKSILRHVQKTYPNVKDVRNDPQYGWVPVFGNPRASLDVSVRRNNAGAWVVSAMIDGYRVQRVYYDYTKKDAVAMFKQENATRKNPRASTNMMKRAIGRKVARAGAIKLVWRVAGKASEQFAYADTEAIAKTIAYAIAKKYRVKVTASRG